MKKIAIIAAVLVLFTACNKEETFSPVKSGTKLTATLGVGTKTSLDGLLVNWTEGDEMVIFDGSAHTFTAGASGSKVAITSDDELSETGTYYGYYPASQFSSVNAGSFTGILPTDHFIEGTEKWDPLAPIMIGSCEAGAEEIPFRNAHALVEFTLPAAASNITVNSDYNLSGPYTATLGDNISIVPSGDGLHYVALHGTLAAGTQYYMPLLPKEDDDDVTIFVRYTATGGNVNQTGMWYYNLYLPPITSHVKMSIEFAQNIITQLDLRDATGVHLDPISQVKERGNYLFLGDDGVAIIIKDTQDASMKFDRFTSEVYSADNGDADDYRVTGSGQSSKCFEFIHDSTTDKWRIRLNKPQYNGSTDSGSYYLAYATHHNGAFYLYRGTDDNKTLFEGFKF